MAVVPISIASLTHISNDLTLLDIISVRHRQLAHMGIQSINPIAVADLDMNAISVVLTHRLDDRSRSRRPDYRTAARCNIHTSMAPIAVNSAGKISTVNRPDKAAGTAGISASGTAAENLNRLGGTHRHHLVHRLFENRRIDLGTIRFQTVDLNHISSYQTLTQHTGTANSPISFGIIGIYHFFCSKRDILFVNLCYRALYRQKIHLIGD